MNTIIEDKIKYYEEKIEQVRQLDLDVTLAQRLMPDANIWVDYEVNIDWPAKSMQEVKDALARFAKAGVMLDYFTEDESRPIWHLKGINGGSVRLSPVWGTYGEAEGASCRLVKIGEETHTYPKYKLVCDKEEKV